MREELTDKERKYMITELAKILHPQSVDLMLSRMPIYRDDQSGELFDEYYDFLQSLFGMQSESSPPPKEALIHMRDLCDKFSYPKNQLENIVTVYKYV